ncbi:MAG: PAS domain S-box protein, partial [Rhodospirillaceae bacterium]|nr:PAS domain S-box protein [Rhodospirillaceae bacterium]
GVGIGLADPNGRILKVNRAFADMLGYEASELAGKHIADITHPEDMGETASNRRRTIAQEKPFYRQEKRYLSKGGETVWARITSTPHFGPDGEFQFSVAMVEGIAERREAELASEQFRQAIDNASEGIIIYDAEERLVFTNKKFNELHPEAASFLKPGAHRRDIRRAYYGSGIVSAASGRVSTFLEEEDARRSAPGAAVEMRRSDGSWRRISNLKLRDGGMVGVVIDITDTKNREEAMRNSESRLAEAQRITHSGSWERDLRTGEEYWSDEYFRIAGFEAQAFKPSNQDFLKLIHREDAERVKAENAKLVAEGGNYDSVFRIVHKDGMERTVRSQGVLLSDAAGNPERTVGTFTDITEFALAEKALAESEGRFRTMFEGAPSGIIIARTDGTFQQCNPAMNNMLGYEDGELNGKHFSEVTHPDDIAENIRMSDQAIAGDISSFTIEKRFLRKDGSVLWALLSVSFAGEVNTRSRFRIAIVEDISQRKEAEAALEESQARLLESQLVANVGNWVIYYHGTEQARVHWSAGQCQIFGLAENSYPTSLKAYLEYVHPDDRAGVEAAWAAASHDGGLYEMDHRILRPDGEIRHISTRARFTYEGSETGWRCVGASIDITERQQAEVALRQSEARLEEAQRIAHIGNWEYDAVSGTRSWSNETYRIFGQEKDHFDPSGDSFTSCIHPDDRERFSRNISNHGAPREPHTHEYRIVRASGEVRALREHSVFEYDSGGKLRRRAGTVQDITELKLAEEQLQQAQKMEAVGQLTGGIAHDFNNLLAVIMGNLELVQDRAAGDSRVRDMIDRCLGAAERGAALTHRLVAFSRRQRLLPSIINLNELVAGMTDLLRRTLLETIEIDIRAAADIGLCEVDQSQLENALLNLAINARDALPRGGTLTIETTNCVLDEEYAAAWAEVLPGQYVMLSVKDDGSGIPEEALEHVFEPFFTTKEVGKGSGLGLSMIYGFVKQSGGHVEIDSAESVGTTVRIYLPRVIASAEGGTGREVEEIRAAEGERVLLVEDDAEVRHLALALLKDMGYAVVPAETAKAALALLADDSAFDLLLTDIVLPGGLNGLELSLRVQKRIPAIKVVYMTGYADGALENMDLLGVGKNLLPKPFKKAELSAVLEHALEGSKK